MVRSNKIINLKESLENGVNASCLLNSYAGQVGDKIKVLFDTRDESELFTCIVKFKNFECKARGSTKKKAKYEACLSVLYQIM